MNSKNRSIIVACLVMILFSTVACYPVPKIVVASPDNKTYQYDFIDIGDTHIGRSKGADNLTSDQRFSLIIKDTNKIVARFLLNQGDLTDGWTQPGMNVLYKKYLSIRDSAASQNHTMLQIRGNHDANTTAYEDMIGPLDWTYRSGDILAVGIGAQEKDALDWEANGTTFNQATFTFLNGVIASSDYQQTTYHILFQHYCTYSKINGIGLPPQMANYYPKFDMIFCGHEGGPQLEKTWTDGTNSVPMIKTAHLGDGTVATDTFLTVSIDRSSNVATVLTHNFVTNQVTPLWSGVIATHSNSQLWYIIVIGVVIIMVVALVIILRGRYPKPEALIET